MGIVLSWVPLITDCTSGNGCDGFKRAAPTATYGVGPLVGVGREPVMPARYSNGGRVLVNAVDDDPWFQGQAYAVAGWDRKTGAGELRREEWGPGVAMDPSSLMATGMFFEGSHQPNDTVVGVLPSGEEVKGKWLMVEQTADGVNDWEKDPKALAALMDAVPGYFA